MAAADEVPWDVETDSLIDSIDAQHSGTGPKLRDILLHPDKYMLKPGSKELIGRTRSDANSYFDALFDSMKDEQAKLTQQLESANAQYSRISQAIRDKAASLKIPYVRPTMIDVDRSRREYITVERYDETVEQLVSKFMGSSNYVADISIKYHEYTLGSWLFSGDRAYVLALEQPKSPLMNLENSRITINGLLDDILDEYVS